MNERACWLSAAETSHQRCRRWAYLISNTCSTSHWQWFGPNHWRLDDVLLDDMVHRSRWSTRHNYIAGNCRQMQSRHTFIIAATVKSSKHTCDITVFKLRCNAMKKHTLTKSTQKPQPPEAVKVINSHTKELHDHHHTTTINSAFNDVTIC